MKEVTRKISLDLARKTNARVCFGCQSDYNSRAFLISVFDDGKPYFVDKGVVASVNVKRGDGACWSYMSDVTEDGKVLYVATLWVFEVPGEVTLNLTLNDGEKRITSSSFAIDVAEDLVPEDNIHEIAHNMTLFQQAMDLLADAAKNEEERKSAEYLRVQDEILRNNAEHYRMNAENLRIEAEQIRVKNEEARLQFTEQMLQAFNNLLTLQQIYIDKGEA